MSGAGLPWSESRKPPLRVELKGHGAVSGDGTPWSALRKPPLRVELKNHGNRLLPGIPWSARTKPPVPVLVMYSGAMALWKTVTPKFPRMYSMPTGVVMALATAGARMRPRTAISFFIVLFPLSFR